MYEWVLWGGWTGIRLVESWVSWQFTSTFGQLTTPPVQCYRFSSFACLLPRCMCECYCTERLKAKIQHNIGGICRYITVMECWIPPRNERPDRTRGRPRPIAVSSTCRYIVAADASIRHTVAYGIVFDVVAERSSVFQHTAGYKQRQMKDHKRGLWDNCRLLL